MNIDTISRHIDKIILEKLEVSSFDDAREMIYKTSKGFKSKLENKDAKKISESMDKYRQYYIEHAEKRIIDMYRLENLYNGKTCHLLFKTLLFKERLEKRDSGVFKPNKKYQNYLKY